MAAIGYLDRAQIGAWFGVSGDAVRKWQERHPAGGEHPFPEPDAVIGGRVPGWLPGRETELRAWKAGLPGQGAPGRPKPRAIRKGQPE